MSDAEYLSYFAVNDQRILILRGVFASLGQIHPHTLYPTDRPAIELSDLPFWWDWDPILLVIEVENALGIETNDQITSTWPSPSNITTNIRSLTIHILLSLSSNGG
jgi:hypothetical protein